MKKAACLIIGSEILRGDINDLHTSFLAKQLKTAGYLFSESVILPDDSSIGSALSFLIRNFDLVITTGGLGPTSDDITRQAVSSVSDSPLIKDESVFSFLLEKLGDRAYGANEIQAMIPSGFTVLPNPRGTAVGFMKTFNVSIPDNLSSGMVKSHEVTLVSLPGPPSEMQNMFMNHVLPLLRASADYSEFPDSYTVFLISEAKIEELCSECKEEGISWGTRFAEYSVHLYVYGEGREKRNRFIDKLKKKVGPYLIYDSDKVDACSILTEILREQKLTISCAESCTAGLVSKLLTDKPGSSDYFWGGVACYDERAKMKLVGVSSDILKKYTAVSEETASAMAEGINNVSGTSVSLSTTGYADERAVVCLGFAAKDRKTQTVKLNFSIKSRDMCRRRYAASSLILCALFLSHPDVALSDITSQWMYI